MDYIAVMNHALVRLGSIGAFISDVMVLYSFIVETRLIASSSATLLLTAFTLVSILYNYPIARTNVSSTSVVAH